MSIVVVLIPHYNSYEALVESIQSIQEEFRVDVLIVDDGSVEVPNVLDLAGCYNNGEVILLKNNINMGITETLNKGLRYIKSVGKYKYIARLDCGDRFYQNKLGVQMKYLSDNRSVYLLGTYVNYVNMNNGAIEYCYKPETTFHKLRKLIYMGNQFCHSSVMFRVECIDSVGVYPTYAPATEDYAYFINISEKYNVANLPIVLVDYEINPNGISLSNRKRQISSTIKVIIKHINIRNVSICYSLLGLLKYGIYYVVPYKVVFNLKKLLKI